MAFATDEEAMSKDKINPDHYKRYSLEAIDMMRSVYGDDAVAMYCEMTAFKYRMRMGTKPGEPVEDDLKKEAWYLNKAKELRDGAAK